MRTTQPQAIHAIFSLHSVKAISRRLLPLLSGVALLCFVAVAQETAPAPATPARPKIVLPDGEGKELVSSKCTLCHTLARIVTSARSEDEWRDLVDTMVGRGADVSPDEAATVVKYLTKNYPPKGDAAAGSAPAGDSSGAAASAPATAAAPASTPATASSALASAPAGSLASPNAAASGSAASAPAKVNLNTATDQELKSALGLSDKDAEDIVKYRTQNGAFKGLEDLQKVRGLDKKTVDAIKDRVSF